MFRTFIPLILATVSQSLIECKADESLPAVERGVKYLRALHQPSDTYIGGGHGCGTAGLDGLALLESGVSSDDAALKNITKYIRANALNQTRTYEASIAIMYLDRLGDTIDRPTIQLLAVRLLVGQLRHGLWSYDCGCPLSEVEAARLRRMFYESGTTSKSNKPQQPDSQAGLHPEVARFAKWARFAAANGLNDMLIPFGNGGDNSNTQFAILALWMAQKHGVSCDDALKLADKRFRITQEPNGGWVYQQMAVPPGIPVRIVPNPATAPMTCAGLLGLAIGRGSAHIRALKTKGSSSPTDSSPKDPAEDKATAAGFRYLENAIRGQGRPNLPIGAAPADVSLPDNLYFLWSLERVAMIYDMEKIGDIDWYKWGADHLKKTQQLDGSWTQQGYTGANAEINTAFALLFLNRANLAKDLTATLKGRANVKLPDRVTNPESIKVEPKQTPTVTAEFDAEANRLCNALASADASRRATTLAQLRDSKGSVFTEGLVRAIGKLQGEPQREAREALAQRLKRMTAATLRDMLKDENRELRSAAAAACGLKEDKQYVPDLIAVLADTDSMVVQSARASLRTLSQKDFGPPPEATSAEKARAINAWRAWWSTQQK